MSNAISSVESEQTQRVKVLLVARYAPGEIGGGQAKFAGYLMEQLSDKVQMFNVNIPHISQVNRMGRIGQSFRIISESISLCLKQKIKVAHIFFAPNRTAVYEKLLLAFVLRLFGVKIILNSRGALDLHYCRFKKFEQWLIKNVMSKRCFVLCQHQQIRQFMLDNQLAGSEQQSAVIYNGITLADTAPSVRFNSPNGVKFAYAGALAKAKGVFDLIEAAKVVVDNMKGEKRQNNFTIHLFGHWEKETEQQKALALIDSYQLQDKLVFEGSVSREILHQNFAAMDALILPSYEEGFPNVVLEGMNFGLLALTTDVGAIPEVVLDGQTGFLFKPGDSNKLGQLMLDSMNNPQRMQQVQKQAWQRLDTFELSKSLAQFEQLYLSI